MKILLIIFFIFSSIFFHQQTIQENLLLTTALKKVEKKVIPKKKNITTLYYQVQRGDGIERIAKKCQLLPENILDANAMHPDVIIHPKDMLIIPDIAWEKIYTGMVIASWYGLEFHKKPMANGEIYNQNDMLIAHRELPLETLVKVTNPKNGRSIILPVKDRGPYYEGRDVDLSFGAAMFLGVVKSGLENLYIRPLPARGKDCNLVKKSLKNHQVIHTSSTST